MLLTCNIFTISADALFRKSDRLLANTCMDIIRDKMDEIHWSSRLITIIGARGVGKSTLIRTSITTGKGMSFDTPYTRKKSFEIRRLSNVQT